MRLESLILAGRIQSNRLHDPGANFEADAKLIVPKNLDVRGKRPMMFGAFARHSDFDARYLRVEAEHLVDFGANLQVPARRCSAGWRLAVNCAFRSCAVFVDWGRIPEGCKRLAGG